MVKKFLKLCVIIYATFAICTIGASAVSIIHSLQINISGSCGTEYNGCNIMLMVTDESDRIVYIDQTVTDENGSYVFKGKVKNDSASNLTAYVNYNGENISDTIKEATAFDELYNVHVTFEENALAATAIVRFEKCFAEIDSAISSARLIMAFYDKNGVLINAKTGSGSLNQALKLVEAVPANTSYAKCFVWNNDERQLPLATSKTRLADQKISCWGDSITMCYNSRNMDAVRQIAPGLFDEYAKGIAYSDALQELSGKTTNNYGVGGENVTTIACRQGGLEMYTKNFTIPADTLKTEVEIYAENGIDLKPFLQGNETNANINPCEVGGVVGTLSLDKAAYNADKTIRYYFARSEAGEAVAVSNGMRLIPASVREASESNATKDITVIFVGTNGGYGSTDDDLLDIVDKMIDQLTYEDKEYVIISTVHGEFNVALAREKAFVERYGERCVPLFSLFRKNADETFQKYGLDMVLTQEQMAPYGSYGSIPDAFLAGPSYDSEGVQIRYDSVHFSALGYYVLGNEVYERMIGLGILAAK